MTGSNLRPPACKVCTKHYVDGPSSFILRLVARFSLVFGSKWTQVGPKFWSALLSRNAAQFVRTCGSAPRPQMRSLCAPTSTTQSKREHEGSAACNGAGTVLRSQPTQLANAFVLTGDQTILMLLDTRCLQSARFSVKRNASLDVSSLREWESIPSGV